MTFKPFGLSNPNCSGLPVSVQVLHDLSGIAFNPIGVVMLFYFIHHGFHPRLLTFRPFGLVYAILKFLCSNCRAATKSCPYLTSCPDPFNREYQTLHATSLLAPRSTFTSFRPIPSHLSFQHSARTVCPEPSFSTNISPLCGSHFCYVIMVVKT